MSLPHHLAKLPSPVQLQALATLLIMTFCGTRWQEHPNITLSKHTILTSSSCGTRKPSSLNFTKWQRLHRTGQPPARFDRRWKDSWKQLDTAGNSLIAGYLVPLVAKDSQRRTQNLWRLRIATVEVQFWQKKRTLERRPTRDNEIPVRMWAELLLQSTPCRVNSSPAKCESIDAGSRRLVLEFCG